MARTIKGKIANLSPPSSSPKAGDGATAETADSQHVYEPERAITHATQNDAARQRTLQTRHQRTHRHHLHTQPTNPRQHLPPNQRTSHRQNPRQTAHHHQHHKSPQRTKREDQQPLKHRTVPHGTNITIGVISASPLDTLLRSHPRFPVFAFRQALRCTSNAVRCFPTPPKQTARANRIERVKLIRRRGEIELH